MSSIVELKCQLDSQKSFLSDLEDADPINQGLITKCKSTIATLTENIVNLAVSQETNVEVTSLTANASFADYSRATLNAAMISKLPNFTGSDPEAVGSFITKLKQLKIATELSDKDLLPVIKGRFSPNAFRILEQHESRSGVVSTLEGLYEFLKSNWSLHLSVFQLLETCYSLKKEPDESWSVFNSRVMTNLNKVRMAHQEFCSRDSKREPTAGDVYSLLQTHMVLNNINTTCPDMFRALTVEQPALQSPAKLAQRAQTLQTQ